MSAHRRRLSVRLGANNWLRTGYYLRRWSASQQSNTGAYVSTTLFIILAPIFLAASHYTSFGRLMAYVGEEHSQISAKRVTAVFVTFDIISLLTQGTFSASILLGSQYKN